MEDCELPEIEKFSALANPTASAATPIAIPLGSIGGVINACDYGLDPGNSAAANNAALAAALAAAAGTPLYIPRGTYDISDTWLLEGIRGQEIFGEGGGPGGFRRSRFRWVGEGGLAVIRLYGSRDCFIRDLEIIFLDSGAVHVDDVFLMETRAGFPMSGNRFRSIYVTGPASKRYNRGFAWVAGSGGNANNDLNTLESVICTHYADTGYDITHAQSTGHKFFGCSGGDGPRMLRTNGAAFAWQEGTSHSGNSDADFKIVGAATVQQSYIKGFRSEGSGCFLDVAIGTSTMSISVEDCSVHSNNLRADERVISWVGRSFLYVRNTRLGNVPSQPLRVHLSSTGNRNAVQHIFENVRIIGSRDNPFTADRPKVELNGSVQTPAAVRYRGFRGGTGEHGSVWGTGERARVSTVAAEHIRDYPDADLTDGGIPKVILSIDVPDNMAGRGSFAVVARKSTGEIWSTVVVAHVVNISEMVTIRAQQATDYDPDSLGYSAELVANGKALEMQVAGGAADNVKWTCVPDLLVVAL